MRRTKYFLLLCLLGALFQLPSQTMASEASCPFSLTLLVPATVSIGAPSALSLTVPSSTSNSSTYSAQESPLSSISLDVLQKDLTSVLDEIEALNKKRLVLSNEMALRRKAASVDFGGDEETTLIFQGKLQAFDWREQELQSRERRRNSLLSFQARQEKEETEESTATPKSLKSPSRPRQNILTPTYRGQIKIAEDFLEKLRRLKTKIAKETESLGRLKKQRDSLRRELSVPEDSEKDKN